MAIRDLQRQQQLQQLVQKLGIAEENRVNWSLLDVALTHPSLSSTRNYQQLEFVGDAVLRLAASEILLECYPESSVGEFAAVRSILVSDRILAELAESLALDRYLMMADSAVKDRTGKGSRLADSFEAVLGALYLSTHTLELIRFWLDPFLKNIAEEVRQDPALQNYKDALQEWTQAHYKSLPQYKVWDASKVHGDQRRFTAEVWFREQQLGTGQGPSKKAAEQAAAKDAFLSIANRR